MDESVEASGSKCNIRAEHIGYRNASSRAQSLLGLRIRLLTSYKRKTYLMFVIGCMKTL